MGSSGKMLISVLRMIMVREYEEIGSSREDGIVKDGLSLRKILKENNE